MRRLFLIAGIIGLAVFCIVLGYALGQDDMLTDRISSALLSHNLGAAENQVVDLESRLIDAELAAHVQRDANNELRKDLQHLHAEIDRLNEEVTFYKSLMAPGEVSEGLQIAEMELRQQGALRQETSRREPRTFHFELLLTQVALRRRYISGEVRIDFIGKQEDEQVVKSLTDLQAAGDYPLRFKFRYFQDLTGQFTLPAGFVPERILVTALQSNRRANEPESLQTTFPWPQA